MQRNYCNLRLSTEFRNLTMQKTIKFLFIVFISMFTTIETNATHVIGGDISVQWLSQNNYRVRVRVYRDCGPGNAAMPTDVNLGIYNLATNGIVSNLTIPRISSTVLVLGDACYTPTGFCVEEGVFETNVFIANNAAGYYLHTQLYARNNIISNILNPVGTGMSFYAEIPDPALGQNSTPDFGTYPTDGYLCTSYRKELQFNISDPDGDSLVYSFVDPLASVGTNNTTQVKPVAGYPAINWAATYSLANICGGVPPMDINPVTGIVTAQPTLLGGVFVFAVRVEEYRNGVKIGETRRDMQYKALNCAVDAAPIILPYQDTVVSIVAGNMNCFDVIAVDTDDADTIYMELITPMYAEGAFYQQSQQVGINQHPYGYYDTITGNLDTLILPTMGVFGNAYFSEGTVGMQFCWQPECQHISVDTLYPLYVESYSLGCSGSDTVQAIVWVQVLPPPDAIPQFLMQVDDIRRDYALNTLCFDIIVYDSDPGDTVFLKIDSPSLPLGAQYTHGTGTYTYFNDATQQNTFVNATASNYNAFFNAIENVQTIGARYCWDLKCEHLGPDYPIYLEAYSIGYCGDTARNSKMLTVHVDTIPNDIRIIPNIFTPNGDGINDFFTIDGEHEPCFDFMNVKVFNRWGRLMYQSEEPFFQWDGMTNNGEQASSGTYFVVMEGQFATEAVSRQYTLTLVRD